MTSLLVLDVNETLSDLAPLRTTFAEIGLPEGDVEPWFAGLLRDAFALTVLGDLPSFADLARDLVAARLATVRPDVDDAGRRAAGERVVEAFVALRPHPDVATGLRRLADQGHRIVTLSNGSASVARSLLEGSGAGDLVEEYLSVEQAGAWKPDPRSYAYALDRCRVEPEEATMVAVHPWDLEGARRAGMQTAWLRRRGEGWPATFGAPDVEAGDLDHLADQLPAR